MPLCSLTTSSLGLAGPQHPQRPLQARAVQRLRAVTGVDDDLDQVQLVQFGVAQVTAGTRCYESLVSTRSANPPTGRRRRGARDQAAALDHDYFRARLAIGNDAMASMAAKTARPPISMIPIAGNMAFLSVSAPPDRRRCWSMQSRADESSPNQADDALALSRLRERLALDGPPARAPPAA